MRQGGVPEMKVPLQVLGLYQTHIVRQHSKEQYVQSMRITCRAGKVRRLLSRSVRCKMAESPCTASPESA